jgi:hypothetical protein
MCIRVIRAAAGHPACSDAGPNKATARHSCPVHIPRPACSASRWATAYLPLELRPVERKAIANQPFAEIGAGHRTRRHGASVLVQRDRAATHWPTRDEGIKIVRGFHAAERYCWLSMPRQSWVLSGASMKLAKLRERQFDFGDMAAASAVLCPGHRVVVRVVNLHLRNCNESVYASKASAD